MSAEERAARIRRVIEGYGFLREMKARTEAAQTLDVFIESVILPGERTIAERSALIEDTLKRLAEMNKALE